VGSAVTGARRWGWVNQRRDEQRENEAKKKQLEK